MNHQSKRKANFELMRIISMFFIVINHILDQKLIVSTYGATNVVLIIITSLIRVHVCSYMLLTGYFQCKSKFKFSKLISLNNSVWFYNLFYLLILTIFGICSLDIVSKLKIISPISYNDYWYVSLYLILYLISPILNIIIDNISKRKFELIILLFITIFSILPTITGQVFFNNHSGFSLTIFILMYFLGAYIRIYPIKDKIIFKNISINLFRIIMISGYLFISVYNVFAYYFGDMILSYGNIFGYIGTIIKNSVFNYDNPFIIISSVFYFLFFCYVDINSKVISKIGKYTFGIYLVHENPLIKGFLYNFLGYNKSIYYINVVPKIIIDAIIIFVIGLFIEMIRQFIFKFIYNRNISCKFRNRYRGYLRKIGLNINF